MKLFENIMNNIISILTLILLSIINAENGKNIILTFKPIDLYNGVQNFEFEVNIFKKSSLSLYWAMNGKADPKINGAVQSTSEQRFSYKYYFLSTNPVFFS